MDEIQDLISEEEQRINELKCYFRQRREALCFSIINRGTIWYKTLTPEQYISLQEWYNAWLNITNTLIEPKYPEWL